MKLPWRNDQSFRQSSCDKRVFHGDVPTSKVKEVNSTDNMPISTNYPHKLVGEDSCKTQSSGSHTKETTGTTDSAFDFQPIETSPCDNIRYLIEDATLCILDGVLCRRTCDDNEPDGILELCGDTRRELRKRRSDRIWKQSQFCCTTISWGPDYEDEISVLQDPIIEEYDGGLNRVIDHDLETPKQKNSLITRDNKKCCAFCGLTKEEMHHCMKICSRCRSTY